MEIKEMADLISGGIDFLVYESENEEEVREIQEAENALYELINLLKEHNIETISELKNMFGLVDKITDMIDRGVLYEIL